MAWSVVPVTNANWVLATQFQEVRAALVERNVAVGSPVTLPAAVSADGSQPVVIRSSYRTAIENIIPYYANPAASYAAYTKATCLTAAIGAADWTAHSDAKMYTKQINEMRSVLNQLIWARIAGTLVTEQYKSPYTTGLNGDTWDNNWANAKTAYGAASWTAGPAGGGEPATYAGQAAVRFTAREPQLSPPGYDKGYDWGATRLADITFPVANYTVADTKFSFSALGLPYRFRLYIQANFGGAATAITGDGVVDIPDVTANATNHLSIDVNDGTLDDFRPTDGNGNVKGPYSQLVFSSRPLLVSHTFDYRS